MKRFFSLSVLMMILQLNSSCDKKKLFDGPNFFQDGFEVYHSMNDLLVEEDELWSHTQLSKARNNIFLDSSFSKTGKQSLRFEAEQTQDGASKSSIAKQNMAFWEGETIRISASYFIPSLETLKWLFLLDLEEQAIIGAGPGMRLAIVDNQLRVEFKFFENDVLQNIEAPLSFPRNEWVDLVWEVKLSTKKEGEIRLWQNDELIIDVSKKRTLPKDNLYFQQGTKGMYSSVEIGITANSHDRDLILWVDDIRFEKI